jgi:hypothetical protein
VFAGQHFDTIDDIFMGVEGFLWGISADFLHTTFHEYVRQLQLCRENGGECIGWTRQNGIFTFVIARVADLSPRQYRTHCTVFDQVDIFFRSAILTFWQEPPRYSQPAFCSSAATIPVTGDRGALCG